MIVRCCKIKNLSNMVTFQRCINTTQSLNGRTTSWRDKKMWKNTEPNLPNWRKEAGLPQNPTSYGPLTNLPDYNFMDGRPTPLGVRQKARLMKQKMYAEKIVESIKELDFAKDRYRKMQEENAAQRENILKNKLKEKGHLLISK